MNFSGRWMNHSYCPNAKIVIPSGGEPLYDMKRDVWYLFVQCERDINKGEEIFINYGAEYHTITRKKFMGQYYV